MALHLVLTDQNGRVTSEEFVEEEIYRQLLRRGWCVGELATFENGGFQFTVESMEEILPAGGIGFHEIVIRTPTLN